MSHENNMIEDWLVKELSKRGYRKGELQWKYRTAHTYMDLEDDLDLYTLEVAICDALSQGGYSVMTGDGTSCVAQMIETAYQTGAAKKDAAEITCNHLNHIIDKLSIENIELKKEIKELKEPKQDEPPLGLLISIAMRMDHSFLCPNFHETEENFRKRQKSLLSDARRAWEEVTGRGFWTKDNNTGYEVQYMERPGEFPQDNQ